MIENEYTFGTSTVYCDGENCSYSEDVEGFDGRPLLFSDVAVEIKKYGWKILKRNGDWVHICPACVESNPKLY
jgi:hypothetical protein